MFQVTPLATSGTTYVSCRRLQLTYVVPEVANGVTWNIPKHYNQKDFVRSFESLPTRFEAQQFIFRMLEIDAITANTDIEITLEPKNVG